MSRAPREYVSNSAADRAGTAFRAWNALPNGEHLATTAMRGFSEAVRVIVAYRDMHAYPMTKVTMGVRSMVKTATRDYTLRPGQRFKRLDRILVKLVRHPHMRLSQMEDIGGCRVVLDNLPQVYAVADRILGRWGKTAHLTDYVAEPKDDGYRGIHIVERRDGRLIEVQLRTPGQHAWAQSIEDYSPVTGFNLKDGEGPDDLRLYFKMAADRIARDERGDPRDPAAEREFARLRKQVRKYF